MSNLTTDTFLQEVQADSKAEFQIRLQEFENLEENEGTNIYGNINSQIGRNQGPRAIVSSQSSKFTSRSRLGATDDQLDVNIELANNQSQKIFERPPNVQPLNMSNIMSAKTGTDDEQVQFIASMINSSNCSKVSSGKVENQENDPNLINSKRVAPFTTDANSNLKFQKNGSTNYLKKSPSSNNIQKSSFTQPIGTDTKSFESNTQLTEQTIGSIATMDRLLESTAELDKLISSNVVDTSTNIHDKRAEALQQAMKTNIDQMITEEKDVAKCRGEFQHKYKHITQSLQQKIKFLQNHLQSRESETLLLKKDQISLSDSLNQQKIKFDKMQQNSYKSHSNLQKDLETSQNHLKSLQESRNFLKCRILVADHDITEKHQIKTYHDKNSDLKKFSLIQEQDAINGQIKFLKQQQQKFINEKSYNQEWIQMLKEDEAQSQQSKIRMVYQMEEFEQATDQFLHQTGDSQSDEISYQERQIISSLIQQGASAEKIHQMVIQLKKQSILQSLIRELQQYLLSINSATTDMSMLNSDQLDNLQDLIHQKQISDDQAVKLICEFAKQQIDCNLDAQQILAKLTAVSQQIQFSNIQSTIADIQKDRQKMADFAQKIKVVTLRICHEIRPQIYALEGQNEKNIENKIIQNCKQIESLEFQESELESKILSHEQKEQKQELQKPSQEQKQLQKEQKDLCKIEYEIHQQEKEIMSLKIKIKETVHKQENTVKQYKEVSQSIQIRINMVRGKLNEVMEMARDNKLDKVTQRLHQEIQDLSCDKEQAQNLLEYATKRHEGIKSRLKHALSASKGVFDGAKGQEQHLSSEKIKIQEFKSIQSCLYGQTQSSRISNIQDQSQNLIHGKILSPSSKKKKQKMTIDSLEHIGPFRGSQAQTQQSQLSQMSSQSHRSTLINEQVSVVNKKRSIQKTSSANAFKQKRQNSKEPSNKNTVVSFRRSRNPTNSQTRSKIVQKVSTEAVKKQSYNQGLTESTAQFKADLSQHNSMYEINDANNISTNISKIIDQSVFIPNASQLRTKSISGNSKSKNSKDNTSKSKRNQNTINQEKSQQNTSITTSLQNQLSFHILENDQVRRRMPRGTFSRVQMPIKNEQGTSNGGTTQGCGQIFNSSLGAEYPGGSNGIQSVVNSQFVPSGFNSALNSCLQSQSSQRLTQTNDVSTNLFHQSQINNEDLRLSMLGIEVSDLKSMTKEHIIHSKSGEHSTKSALQQTSQSAQNSTINLLQLASTHGIQNFGQQAERAAENVYDPFKPMTQQSMQEFQSVNFFDRQQKKSKSIQQKKEKNKQRPQIREFQPIQEKYKKESHKGSQVQISKVIKNQRTNNLQLHELQYSHNQQPHYLNPTFSSQIRTRSQQRPHSQYNYGRASQKSIKSQKSGISSQGNYASSNMRSHASVARISSSKFSGQSRSQNSVQMQGARRFYPHNLNKSCLNVLTTDNDNSVLIMPNDENTNLVTLNNLEQSIENQALAKKKSHARSQSSVFVGQDEPMINFKSSSNYQAQFRDKRHPKVASKVKHHQDPQFLRQNPHLPSISNSVGNLNLKQLSHATNINHFANQATINQKIRLSSSQNGRQPSKGLNRDIQDMKIAYQMSLSRLKNSNTNLNNPRGRNQSKKSSQLGSYMRSQSEDGLKLPLKRQGNSQGKIRSSSAISVYNSQKAVPTNKSYNLKMNKSVADVRLNNNNSFANFEDHQLNQQAQSLLKQKNQIQGFQEDRKGLHQNKSLGQICQQQRHQQLRHDSKPTIAKSQIKIRGTSIDDVTNSNKTVQRKILLKKPQNNNTLVTNQSSQKHFIISKQESYASQKQDQANKMTTPSVYSLDCVNQFSSIQNTNINSVLQSQRVEAMQDDHRNLSELIIEQNEHQTAFKKDKEFVKYSEQVSEIQTPQPFVLDDSYKLTEKSENLQEKVVNPEKQSTKKMLKLEFKRYDPSQDCLETYFAKVPSHQDKIVQFFTLIKPLVEGCKFVFYVDTSANIQKCVKIELPPNNLEILKITSDDFEKIILVKNIKKLDLPQTTLDAIKNYKQEQLVEQNEDNNGVTKSNNNQQQYNFEFKIKMESGVGKSLEFSTKKYSHLKRWTLGVNALVQNQKSLSKLGMMLQKQQY